MAVCCFLSLGTGVYNAWSENQKMNDIIARSPAKTCT